LVDSISGRITQGWGEFVLAAVLWEFLLFGLKQARACVFAGSFLFLLLLSRHVPLFGLARYDFLFLAAVCLQILFLALRIETLEEVVVLGAFHLVGLGLELFKTHPSIAAWSYPEAGLFKVATVPLYSGFMYAAVASYKCQAWRLLRLELENYPPYWQSVPLAAGVYVNFFTKHFMPDVRWLLVLGILWVFRRCRVHYLVWRQRRTMPLLLSYALIGFFIWIAENTCTYLGAWVYPEQRTSWHVVSPWIISSWILLVIVSFIIVADLKHFGGRQWRSRFTRTAVAASLSGSRSYAVSRAGTG
jgi:uncharacterized membrane protein YoaT (DUF817 family)